MYFLTKWLLSMILSYAYIQTSVDIFVIRLVESYALFNVKLKYLMHVRHANRTD